MQEKILREAAQHMKQNRQKRIRNMLVRVMACIVVFCTTYALILPAITMEKQRCGLEEHTHSESCYKKAVAEPVKTLSCTYETLGVHVHTAACYDSEKGLVCGLADYVIHSHNDACRDENGNVVCGLPVVQEHTHTEACYSTPEAGETHTHSEACYTKGRGEQICGKAETEGHTHSDDCYTRGELVCQLSEQEGHTHGAECSEKVLTCELTVEAHQHTDSCYQQQVCELAEDETHTHSDACSGKVLSCELTEQPHNHTDGCYQTKYLCDLPETEGHTHTDSCYAADLVCEKAEEEAHSHSDSCFEETSTLTCGLEEGTPVETEAEPELVCEKEVIQRHTHDEASCYESSEDGTQKWLICDKPQVTAHVHGESCFVTEEAEEDALTCGLTEGHTHGDACKDENGVLTCTEAENHTHSDRCYGTWELICGKEVHTHTDECYEAEEKEETTAPTNATESSEETTAPTEAEELDLDQQILTRAALPKDYLVQPTAIEGTNVTWEVYKNDLGEYVLRFDGEGAIPDYTSTNRSPWLDYIGMNRYFHLEFGDNVTTVGQWAFYEMDIYSIKWGGITEIKNSAFAYGSGPSIFEIPGSVKIVRNAATFVRWIDAYVLNEGTEILERSCFSHQKSGSGSYTLHIPASVKVIDGPPRAQVTAYTVAEDNPNYCAVDGVLYTMDMKTLIAYPQSKIMEEFRIPDGVETISFYAFYGASIGKLIIPPSVKVIEARIGEHANIKEVYFEDGSKLESTGSYMFYLAGGLTNIRYPENTAIPLLSMINNSHADQYKHFTVPNKITSIGYLSGNLPNLETLTYNAENANITTDKLFNSSGAYDLIIGDQVNHLPAKFSCVVSPSKAVYFRGENTFTADSGAFTGAGEPLENLSGKFYVDANGVLYQCMDDGTAKVVYASGDVPAELTIPASIQTDDSTTYQITAVGGNAFRAASNLTSLTFAAPTQITELAPQAMANCATLETVNGKTTKEEAEATFPEGITKTNLFFNTRLDRYSGDQNGDGILDGVGQQNLSVKHDGAMDMDINLKSDGKTMVWTEKADGSGLYTLLTGDTLTVTASVGNTEGKEAYVYRVYVRKTRADGTLDIAPGETYTFDGQIAMCYATEAPNVVYLEFSPTVGATVSVPINLVYPSPGSPGGGMEIWGVIQTTEEAQNTANTVVNGDKIIQAQWSTKPDDFALTKISANSTSFDIVGNGTGGGKPDRNLMWTITLQRATETVSAYGKDYVTSAVCTDIITLPEGFYWNAQVEQAAKSGKVEYRGSNFYVGDFRFAIFSRSSTSATMKNVEVYWDTEKDTLAFRWEMSNGNTTAEMNASTLTLTILPDALSIDMSKVQSGVTYTIPNTVTADVHYHYSAPVPLSASADKTAACSSAHINMNKKTSGVKYFGEDVAYTIDLYNYGGLPYGGTEGTTYTLVDELSLYSYIKPEDMEEMFLLYGTNLVIEISDAVLAPWQSVTGVDGTTAWQNSGNSNLGTAGHTLTISVTQAGKYQVLVDGETAIENESLAAALQSAGYAVTELASYTCTWTLNQPDSSFTLIGGEHRIFYVYATVKDSFKLISEDWLNTYPTNEPVLVTNRSVFYSWDANGNSRKIDSANASDTVRRDAAILKTTYKDGQELEDASNVNDGDVLTYSLDFYHYGTGSYENLPMVDDMYGSQYLLVPVDGNDGLAGKNLLTHDDEGISYYILKEGTYTNVTVGVDDEGYSLIAASIAVSKEINEKVVLNTGVHTYTGIHTKIKWYFPETPKEGYLRQVRYKALVDMSQSGETYTVGNAVWMNDRTDTRIYNFIWDGDTIIKYNKVIVPEDGSTSAGLKYSTIGPGSQVTYCLTLENPRESSFTLNGKNLGDGLPETHGVFQWDTTNVTLTKIETAKGTVNHTGLDQWGFATEYNDLDDKNRQYIVWPETTSIELQAKSTLCLYFTLTFPDHGEGDLWNRYAAAVSGNKITNTLYVYRFPSAVEHNLLEPGEVLLQKGVSGVYYYSATGGYSEQYTPAGTSVRYFNNRDIYNRSVMYYVTLYNGESKRLYVDDLYDQLPKGFTFKQMITSPIDSTLVRTNWDEAATVSGEFSGGNGFTEIDSGTVVCRNAIVKPERTENGVVFRINAGSGDYALRYDQEKGKHYLNRGEALVFTYMCDIGTATETEDSATNAIAMPYDDYLDNGLTISEVPVRVDEPAPFKDTNDGARYAKANQEVVDQYGFPSSSEEQWLVSDVTLTRGKIIPGVTKYTDGYTLEGNYHDYTASAIPTSTIQWRVRLHNSGTAALVDYTFSDIMPKPYVFEGEIRFEFHDAKDENGEPIKTQTVVTLPTMRSPGNAPLEGVVGYGRTQNVPLDGTWKDIGSTASDCRISIKTDENDNEVLSLHCKTAALAIPEGGYIDVILSSRNPTTDHFNAVYVNRATLQPNVQKFENVGHGSMMKDADGNAIGAENYSPVNVTFGYATTSEKRVTEDSRPENTAVSTDPSNNSIILENVDNSFTYKLTVGNETEIPMTKLVVIDNLPQPNDPMPFAPDTFRNSDFTVYFADDPNFAVKVIDKDGNGTELTEEQYTLEFSTATSFGGPQSDDWKGEDTGKWSADRTGARSFRMIINDPDGTLVPHESKVEITFKARADENAEPGMIAWNNFGYHYGLKGISGELEAMPLTVGVSIPSVPDLKKQLVDLDGNTVTAEEDLTFSFLVYTGEALEGSYETEEAWHAALAEAGRSVQKVTVTVPAGQSESDAKLLEFVGWEWQNGDKYSVVELPYTTNRYHFLRFEDTGSSQYTFTYDEAYTQTIVCVNRLEEWGFSIKKTDPDGNTLSGAVFALYSPSEADLMDPDEAERWNAQRILNPEAEGEPTWYLKAVATTGEDGIHTWTGLLEDSYYLLELQAPEGYRLSEEGRILYRSTDRDRVVEVINKPVYELPETGGMGTTLLYIISGTMMLISVVVLAARKRTGYTG